MVEAAVKAVLIFLIGFVAFLPYHVNYETAFSSIEGTTNQTVLCAVLADRRPVRVRHRLVCGQRVARLAHRRGTNRLASLLQTRLRFQYG